MVSHTSIDTEAAWTKSGWHGWVYGWKLHLIATVAAVWIPLAAALTTRRFALGAIFVYQIALLYRFEHGLDLRVGLKASLKAA